MKWRKKINTALPIIPSKSKYWDGFVLLTKDGPERYPIVGYLTDSKSKDDFFLEAWDIYGQARPGAANIITLKNVPAEITYYINFYMNIYGLIYPGDMNRHWIDVEDECKRFLDDGTQTLVGTKKITMKEDEFDYFIKK